jgi:hypothetical protein
MRGPGPALGSRKRRLGGRSRIVGVGRNAQRRRTPRVSLPPLAGGWLSEGCARRTTARQARQWMLSAGPVAVPWLDAGGAVGAPGTWPQLGLRTGRHAQVLPALVVDQVARELAPGDLYEVVDDQAAPGRWWCASDHSCAPVGTGLPRRKPSGRRECAPPTAPRPAMSRRPWRPYDRPPAVRPPLRW